MKNKTILSWTPRILGLLFAAFLALFASTPKARAKVFGNQRWQSQCT